MSMAFADVVGKLCPGSSQRVAVISSAAQLRLCDRTTAIVFVHAAWSGPSAAALLALDRVLTRPLAVGVPVFVVNADLLADGLLVGGGYRQPEGNGETYLVKDGIVKAALDRYSCVDIARLEMSISQVFGPG